MNAGTVSVFDVDTRGTGNAFTVKAVVCVFMAPTDSWLGLLLTAAPTRLPNVDALAVVETSILPEALELSETAVDGCDIIKAGNDVTGLANETVAFVDDDVLKELVSAADGDDAASRNPTPTARIGLADVHEVLSVLLTLAGSCEIADAPVVVVPVDIEGTLNAGEYVHVVAAGTGCDTDGLLPIDDVTEVGCNELTAVDATAVALDAAINGAASATNNTHISS